MRTKTDNTRRLRARRLDFRTGHDILGRTLATASRKLRDLCLERDGVTAVVVALSASAILGFAGLAIDVGIWYSDKRTIQGVVDMAAFSAATTYATETAANNSSALTDAVNTAYAIAAAHGFVNGSHGVTVTVNDPPGSGSHKTADCSSPANGCGFEIIINKPEPIFFSGQFASAITSKSRAVGLFSTTSTTGTGCVSTTDGSSNGYLHVTGSGAIKTYSCTVTSAGTGSTSLQITGGSTIVTSGLNAAQTTQNSSDFTIGETAVQTNCTSNTSCSTKYVCSNTTTCVNGAVNWGASVSSAYTNPYSGTTLSSIEASTNTTISCSQTSTPTQPSGSSADFGGVTVATISPGVYCGGLHAGASSNVTMQSGVYYIVGGQFTVDGAATLTGTGVTIVLVKSGSSFPTINIAGSGNANLSSPSTGATAGIVFYGDPSYTGTVNFSGAVSPTINGAMVFPNAVVNYSGSASTNSCSILIAYDLTVTGAASFGLNNCSAYGVTPIGSVSTNTVAVVE